MIFLTVIFVGIAAFLGGLAVGIKDVPPKAPTKIPEPCEETDKLQKEYENFLYYDGSVQE